MDKAGINTSSDTKKSDLRLIVFLMVPGAGLEPAWYHYRTILSRLRLPISPPGEFMCLFIISDPQSEIKGKLALFPGCRCKFAAALFHQTNKQSADADPDKTACQNVGWIMNMQINPREGDQNRTA